MMDEGLFINYSVYTCSILNSVYAVIYQNTDTGMTSQESCLFLFPFGLVNTNLIYATGLCDKFFVITKFWPNVWSISEQTHGNLIFVLMLMAW